MKLLVTRQMTARATQAIRDRFDATFGDETPLGPSEAAQALADYDAIMPTLGDAFPASAFQGEPRCRILANFGAGYNHIDVRAAADAGVVVTNTPDVVTEATADIALTLILMTMRRASEGERILRAGQWTGWKPTQLLGGHATGSTVGIVGMGRIGQAVARRCHFGFGMDVVFFNRSIVTGLDVPARQIADLDDMLARSDVAVVAVPGGAGTRHLIGAAQMAALGPAGYLVNIARGDVVDEAALIDALTDRRIAGAGLDVYEREPVVPQALRDAPNATLLPHLGTATDDVRTAMGLRALDNLAAFARGDAPHDRVN
ncbi:D-glycerate dehydrogenase [Paracoccus sediminis]|jgi:lactate dehydrogenase-like 2-hydroxyacid dehydrogenase|uniref:D-glycerate dehydrogenase n=1 Tax=Paracoccus sediminis TaxID=1214787 RepID=A0A238Y5I3_9RHOB|nr:D-glycerate dehydrogenase [Paracoccus sediminis]TBN47256.1 D-glycerate dehydrogenase [Paracoccus sediminis]SNR65913.1 Lactate dehydrogenase [Paracoccus sediminis]